MKKVSIAVIGGAAMTFASLAQAADLPYRSAAPGNYDYPPSFTWGGFYAGLNAGAGFGAFSGAARTISATTRPAGCSASPAATITSRAIWWSAWKAITTGRASPSDATVYPGVTSTGIVQNVSTIRARFGYAMDRILIYGTGGYAGGSIRGVISNFQRSSFSDQSHLVQRLRAGPRRGIRHHPAHHGQGGISLHLARQQHLFRRHGERLAGRRQSEPAARGRELQVLTPSLPRPPIRAAGRGNQRKLPQENSRMA